MKKRWISGVLAWVLLLALVLTACGGEPQTTEPTNPETTVGSGEVTDPTESTGGADGETDFPDMSGLSVEEAVEAFGFYVVDEDASGSYSTGDTIYFGSYPQELVTEGDILTALTEKAGALPTAEAPGDWISYGYYDAGARSDYAFYRDVTVDGERYRGVYLLAYRPYYARMSAGADNSYIDDNGLELGTVYWYHYSGIAWNVLSYDAGNGTVLLASRYNLDAQPFQACYEFTDGDSVVIPGTQTPINDWESSTVRAFLNGEFFEAAFSDRQRTLVQRVTADNRTTGYSVDAPYQQGQNDTDDKVFLLSCTEAQNKDYGYSSKGASRIRSYTDYAASQGLRSSSQSSTGGEPACCYLLRSAGAQSYSCAVVSKMGAVSYDLTGSTNTVVAEDTTESVDGLAYNGDLGVLPALVLQVAQPDEETAGQWVNASFDYTNGSGESARLDYGVYVPAAYEEGDELPLIIYIPDSSYVGRALDKIVKAQCPVNWATEEKMREHPCFFLIFAFQEVATDISSEGSEGAQIVPVLRQVMQQYGIDPSRIYLTGQSMGGIADFALNDAYPDLFAATVYVGCQPGPDVGDDQYLALFDSGKFLDQTFVYIASRMDEKAPFGQDDVEAALVSRGAVFGKNYELDPKGGDALEAAVWEVLQQGCRQNLLGFPQLTASGDGAAEHMQSFKYVYAIDAIFEWLMAQHK